MFETNDRRVNDWVRQLGSYWSSRPNYSREEMEDLLVHMIRCALRTGLGRPELLDWVNHHLPLLDPNAGPRPDPGRYARPLARVLGEQAMTRHDPLAERETVIGI
jgi:hypothetical protein